ncbi:hypothetical protein EUAN_11900 [Andreesenia angusta]|uniref:RNA-binding S4 domain-containing protein n=1 Tax=Andreesenia angusta TaxID=39480 RepID=A0A1S1V885_9FIRM|nr:YlmH/Sll1252 family protein [Andreesenia angusta]OHW62625.1 hypothetical protein EUAN_11900 [Andreesenia angusta]
MMKNKEKYLEHIKDKGQYDTMRRLLDKIEIVERNYEAEWTDFLDPYQIRLSESILNRFDVNYYAEGGTEEAERKSIVIYPEYLSRDDVENPVAAIEIVGSFKFNEVSHRDYLGSILGTGVKREKIGDIYIGEGHAQAVLHRDILDYVKANLERIGKERVQVKEIPLSEVENQEVEYEDKVVVVSSERLDVMISEVYSVSRAKSKSIVSSDRVKVNWAPTSEPSLKLSSGDLVSVRKLGRFIVGESRGTTRKDNERLEVRLYK